MSRKERHEARKSRVRFFVDELRKGNGLTSYFRENDLIMEAILIWNDGKVTCTHNLLWQSGEVLDVLKADELARKCGLERAEQLVKAMQNDPQFLENHSK